MVDSRGRSLLVDDVGREIVGRCLIIKGELFEFGWINCNCNAEHSCKYYTIKQQFMYVVFRII